MDEKEFFAIARETKLKDSSIEAARLHFVEGVSPSLAGAMVGKSKQHMTQICDVIEKKRSELQESKPISQAVEAVEASYAFAVKAARDQYGDEVRIGMPADGKRFTGSVIARTDFHLVQFLGKDAVVVHDLAKLSRVPPIGQNIAIEYANGHGEVIDRSQERTRGGLSR